MSYILDALQRAEAERSRGTAPSLHAPPPLPASSPALHPNSRFWLLMTVLAGALATTLLLWWRASPTPPSGAASTPTTTALAPISTPPLASATPLALPVSPLPAAAPTAPAKAYPPASFPTAAAKTSSAQTRSGTPQAPAPAVASSAATTSTATSATTEPTKIPFFANLPPELQQQIPRISITGAVYSANPTQRLLLVNGQVLMQDSQVATDLRLEEIREHEAVLVFKGTRFRLAH